MFTLVSNSLTDSCLVNLIVVTLACGDANSKLAVEDRVGNNLLQISELRFGQKLNFCSDFEHKGWSRFRS